MSTPTPVLTSDLKKIHIQILKSKEDAHLENLRVQYRTANRMVAGVALSSQVESTLMQEAAQMHRSFLEETNRLFFGREEWLKQMRKAKEKILKRPLTVAEETGLNNDVKALLLDRTQEAFLANYKYVSDVPEAVKGGKNSMGAGMQKILSKMTDAFGDGPLGEIGKIFTKILGFVFTLFPFFKEMGEELNMQKKPLDLMKEGNLDGADSLMTAQELELIQKLKAVQTTPIAQIIGLVKAYEDDLNKLKEVSFADANETFRKDNISLRINMFNEVSSKAKAFFSFHEEKVKAEMDEQAWVVQQASLQEQLRSPGIVAAETSTLNIRLERVAAEMRALQEKRDLAEAAKRPIFVQFQGVTGKMQGNAAVYANQAKSLVRQAQAQQTI